MVDASLGEIMTTCEKITWLLDEDEKWLKPEYRLESLKLFLRDGKVVQVAVRAALQSSGQNCAGAERFYVHNHIYSAFVSQVVNIVKSICIGPPLSGRYDMGAICMLEHSEKLQSLVNDALDKGAEIVVRGSFGTLGEDAVDQFFPQTVLVNVDHTMKIMQEEEHVILGLFLQARAIVGLVSMIDQLLPSPIALHNFGFPKKLESRNVLNWHPVGIGTGPSRLFLERCLH